MDQEISNIYLSQKISVLLKLTTLNVHNELEKLNIMAINKPTLDNNTPS